MGITGKFECRMGDRDTVVELVDNFEPIFWTINEKCDHVFEPTGTIFKLLQDIVRTILMTKFHEDQTINVASRVLTRKNAPPLLHDDRTINVASIECKQGFTKAI
ncbi:hypothetical protein DPMN_118056 [Dreissena polymorpha]|uniref:Uncharacterized protein n=1 Tax=Dreissena polymorpha TaxID=45954 RepID=A0A9D4GJG9_DREPO|nr:hypothetical protein DPMN_118056 [Dreissena polymorpha]